MKKDTKMIKAMETNYKVLRRVHDSIYSNAADNVHPYLFSLDFPEKNETENDININGPGIATIREKLCVNSLLNSFDLFYYTNGRFPFTKGRVFTFLMGKNQTR